ncbi:type VI secretion system contractile sheath domain-containing protein [Myxococcus qinghaiensis]|uniref:type VI secretion system contractile sheath domain-containing protein n=1 Tax=Myxococcus qinghaiensis TaxID=2906758 RepID=UPI0020A7206E|nr:type VI secretion system contractile sheath large subunit [Myxococcus qinghaiensis]MCP3166187.1 type VI secretion system contractile sheath large subunit [Myxococcus qinghaiensis]
MSQSGSSAEGARVRWLVAGAFSSTPSGRRFHVSSDTFASELAKAASHVRFIVPDRLGAEDTRALELSFERLRDFGVADVLTRIPALRDLHALRDQLTPALSPEEAAKRVEAITGPGRLPEAVAAVLRDAAPPPSPAPAPPPAVPADDAALVEALLNQAEPPSPATAARAVDAFVKALNPRAPASGSSTSAPATAARKSVRDLLDETVLRCANDVLIAEPVARLESAWRGLKWLVDQCPASAGMAVEVLDVSRGDLLGTLEDALSGEPFDRPDAVFVVDTNDDVAVLARLAAMGERAQLPIIAAVAPSLLGLSPDELALGLEEGREQVSESWTELRQDESSRWLCAVVNRVVVASEARAKRAAFTSPALAVAAMLASSFRDTSAFARIFGQAGGVRAPTTWEIPSGREKGLSIPTEVFLPIRAQAKLEEHGVLGLGSGRNADAVLLAGAPTVYGGGYAVPLPAQVLTGRIVRFATWVRDQLPPGSGSAEVASIFSQAAEVFLFRGATEDGQLKGEVVPTGSGHGVHVTATVRPEHAGTRFQLAFTLPLRA